MRLRRFAWWFLWGASSGAFLLIVLKGAGLGVLDNLLMVSVAGLGSGAVASLIRPP